MLTAAFRFDLAAVLMVGYAAVTTTRWIPATWRECTTVLAGGTLSIALHHALLFAGQQHVTSAVAAVVICLDPILAAVFARLLPPHERISWIDGLGLAVSVLGVGILAGLSPVAVRRTDPSGVALVFLAAAAFALGAVLTRRFQSDLPVQAMLAWMMLVGAPLLHGAAFVLPGEQLAAVSWSWTALAGLGYLTVVAAGVGYILYFELLDRLGAIGINLVAYMTPVFAAFGGWIVFGEQLHLQTVAGFGSIVIGFILIKRHALRMELSQLRA